MDTHLYGLILGVLATWRVTHLLQAEDGPGDVFVRFRRSIGSGFLGSLLDCFYCLSLWVAAPLALLVATSWSERAMLWLALSGGACLLERTRPSVPAVTYFEDKEETEATSSPSPTSSTSSSAPPTRS